MRNLSQNNDQSFHLLEKVIARLERRCDLAEIADSVSKNSVDENVASFLTEADGTTFCLSEGKNGYQSTKTFACDNSFTCYKSGQSFMCNSGNHYTKACLDSSIYNNCGGGTAGFQCHNDTPFLCNEKTLFDCPRFKCGVSGNNVTETFTCNARGDFNCARKNSCVDSFSCTAGHIHLCVTEFACDDKYDCAGGAECEPKGSTAIFSCSHKSGEPAYADTGDNEPGDFNCGGEYLKTKFDCKKDFNCISKSDFMCEEDTSFKCKNFTCVSGGEIESYVCRATFECTSTPPYQCTRNGSSFWCFQGTAKAYDCDSKASYSRCQSDVQKECKNKYNCPAPNNCVAPGFQCTSSSPYTPPPPPSE